MSDLSERLFTHFVGGRWRVPFGSEARVVRNVGGASLGQVLLATPRDLARAQASLRGATEVELARVAKRLGAADQFPIAPAPVIYLGPMPARGSLLGAMAAGLIWAPPLDTAAAATDFAAQLQAVDAPPGAFALLHAACPETAPLWPSTGLRVCSELPATAHI